MNHNEKIKENFDKFHQELNEIRKETEELNKNLPSYRNKDASFDQKVKEALDINLLNICEK